MSNLSVYSEANGLPHDSEFRIDICSDHFHLAKKDLADLVQSSRSKYLSFLHEPNTLIEALSTNNDAALILAYRGNKLVSALPLVQFDRFPLSLSILPKWNLKTAMWNIVGGHPLLLEDGDIEPLHNILNTLIKNTSRPGIFIEQLPTDSPLAKAFKSHKTAGKYYPCFAEEQNFHSLQLSENYDDFLKTFKRKRRYNLNRSVKQLQEVGTVEVIESDTPESVAAFLEAADIIQKKSWQGSTIGTSGFASEEVLQTQKCLANQGLFRSFFLTVDNEPVAFVRGYQYGQRYFYEEIGYDPKWKSHSPGTILNWLFFPLLYNKNPPRKIEFGLGDSQYKRVFGNESSTASRGVFSKQFSTLSLLGYTQSIILATERSIRTLLIRFNLDKKIRALLRKV